jgi:hypothetical protein
VGRIQPQPSLTGTVSNSRRSPSEANGESNPNATVTYCCGEQFQEVLTGGERWVESKRSYYSPVR